MARTDVRNETRLQARTKLGWRSAADLKPGDIVVTKGGRVGRVKSLTPAPGLHTVHNFAVDDHHTYFVGDGDGVWVHNRYNGDDGLDPENPSALTDEERTALREERREQLAKGGLSEDEIDSVFDVIDSVSEDSPLATRGLKGRRQERLLEAAGYTEDQIRALRRGDDFLARAVIAAEPQYENVINFDALGRIKAEDILEVLPMINRIKDSGPVDIFIGGAGDRGSDLVAGYQRRFGNLMQGRSVFYFEQGNRGKAIALAAQVDTKQDLNLIGHSWGGYDVAIVATRLEKIAPERRITRLIGIDAVNKPGGSLRFSGDSPRTLSNVDQIIYVDATGTEKRLNDGNFIAGVGRLGGGGYPDIFKNENAIRIEAPYAHFNFEDLFEHSPQNGQSAHDLLLGLPAPAPAPTP